MLNEERVKQMVKLASYESRDGVEEVKISMYEKNDYVRFQRTMAAIWVTIGYILAIALLAVVYIPKFIEDITVPKVIITLCAVVIIYIVILIECLVISSRYYLKKYVTARRNVKQFVRDLDLLDKMYEKEGR